MKLTARYFILLNVFFAGAIVAAGESPGATNAPEDMAALSNYLSIANAPPNPTVISNYLSIAARCDEIVARVPPPKDIESALRPFSFGYPERLDPKQADWPQRRAEIVSGVLTNLGRLEDGLRVASAMTNIEIKPPDRMYYLMRSWQTNQYNSHPEMVAARVAGQAYHRVLDVGSDLGNIAAVQNRIIENIAEAYAYPPPADDEVRRLLAPYAGYRFAAEFTNALNRKVEEFKYDPVIDPVTGQPILRTNRAAPAQPR